MTDAVVDTTGIKITMRGGAVSYDAHTIKLKHDGEGIDVELEPTAAMIIQRTDYRNAVSDPSKQIDGYPKKKVYLLNGGADTDVVARAHLEVNDPTLSTLVIDEFIPKFWTVRLDEASGATVNNDMTLEIMGAVNVTAVTDAGGLTTKTLNNVTDDTLPPPPPPPPPKDEIPWMWIGIGVTVAVIIAIILIIVMKSGHGATSGAPVPAPVAAPASVVVVK